MSATDARARVQTLLSAQSTHALVASLLQLEAWLGANAAEGDERAARLQSRTWIIGTLEVRYPEAEAAVVRAFEDAEAALVAAAPEGDEEALLAAVDVDYVGVLVAAIPEADR